jgi:hypothetical protein
MPVYRPRLSISIHKLPPAIGQIAVRLKHLSSSPRSLRGYAKFLEPPMKMELNLFSSTHRPDLSRQLSKPPKWRALYLFRAGRRSTTWRRLPRPLISCATQAADRLP